MKNIHEIIGKYIELKDKNKYEQLKKEIGFEEPKLTDPSLMSYVVHLYCEICKITYQNLMSKKWNRKSSFSRYYIVYILYKLYSPNTMNPKIREIPEHKLNTYISNAVGIKRNNNYVIRGNTYFYYQTYYEFSCKCDEIYSKIINRLISDEII